MSGLGIQPATGAHADEAPSREVRYRYNYATLQPAAPYAFATFGAVHAATERGERRITLRIADATQRPVGIVVEQDVDGDGGADLQREICGRDRSLRIMGGAMLVLQLVYGPCANGTRSLPTTGTVEITFQR
ncbi:MAG: hypothetical protein M3271_09530 [Actinomycetota bacterium]|nr:hypothetical protein [Actinomycetota bacterium]